MADGGSESWSRAPDALPGCCYARTGHLLDGGTDVLPSRGQACSCFTRGVRAAGTRAHGLSCCSREDSGSPLLGRGRGSQMITALCGGVGGSKLVLGLYRTLPPDELIVVVNTADDL